MNGGTPVIVLMQSVHHTLKMEDALENGSIAFRSVVKPRALGTDCGIALRIDAADLSRAREIAGELDCPIFGVYYKADEEWREYRG